MNNSNTQERYYNILKLNKWFALSSILFTAFWIMVFADDYNRPWKKYQIEFRKLEAVKIKQDIESEDVALSENDDYNKLIGSLESIQSNLELQSEAISEINSKIKSLSIDLYRDNQNYQFSKADMDAQRYKYEEALYGNGDVAREEKKYLQLKENTDAAFLIAEKTQLAIDSLNEKLRDANSIKKEYDDQLFSLTKEKQLLERQLSKLDPESMSLPNKLANIIRDLPVIDFIDPFYDVKQVVVNDLEDDLIYMGMPKVDRCMTCHVGIDKKETKTKTKKKQTKTKERVILN